MHAAGAADGGCCAAGLAPAPLQDRHAARASTARSIDFSKMELQRGRRRRRCPSASHDRRRHRRTGPCAT
ncbi:MAG: hypothetical protein ACLUNQ_08240 [Oscillospiraceae bacterium]